MSINNRLRSLSIALSAMLITVTLPVSAGAGNQRLKEQYPIAKFDGITTDESIRQYDDYLIGYSSFKDAKDATVEVSLKGSSALKTENGESYIYWDEKTEKLDFTFSVKESGFYNLLITYMTTDSSAFSPKRRIKLDGEYPFKEAMNIEFRRQWIDDGLPFKNPAGDDVRPGMKEIYAWQEYRVEDADGMYALPLKFMLSGGLHTITLENIYEPLKIKKIEFVSPEEILSYSEVSKNYSNYDSIGEEIKIDAEYAAVKSYSGLQMQYSSDPCADPAPNGQKIVNTIGGTSWSASNQYITYKFRVNKSGLYKINWRIKQDTASGLPVYRQIRVDGKIPFKEFESYGIGDSEWSYKTICDKNNDPYLIYLTAEDEHEISFISKVTGYKDILHRLDKIMNNISYAVQKIVLVTSLSPDPQFDYKLEEKIPDLINTLKIVSEDIGNQIESLRSMVAGKSRSAVSTLLKTKLDIDEMIDNPSVIAAKLSNLTNAQTSISSWRTSTNLYSMEIDYLTFTEPNAEIKDYHSSFFQILYYSFKSFTLSFVKDYNSISGLQGSSDKSNDKKPLEVWISRGQEWGNVLQQMCTDEYSAKYNKTIDLNIFPSGNLGTSGVVMLSIASGNAPDVILGGDSGLATEYGMRGAMLDLTQFEDFGEINKRFLPGISRSYVFNNTQYALPETMDFNVLFYRSDIMKELNLPIPNTWDELYIKVLPTLKKNGLDFWYEGGFNTFLYQQGGEYYTEDGKKTAFDTPEAIEAFKQFTDLYRVYEVPVSADFYSRFRIGQMPLGISSFNTYLKFSSAAPEMAGKWDVAMIPGTKKDDGTVNRSFSGGSTGCMILSGTDDKEEAWNFIKWYTSREAQEKYARDITTFIGQGATWCSANIEAFNSMSWESNLRQVMNEQQEWLINPYNVVGGYITARHLENARVRTVVSNMNYRESLEIAVEAINRELKQKNEEFEKVNAAQVK